MSESDFGRITAGGQQGTHHETTGTTGTTGHVGGGHHDSGTTHAGETDSHGGEQNRQTERKDDMTVKTLAALLGAALTAILFLGDSGFAATKTARTTDTTFAGVTSTNDATGDFAVGTQGGFTNTRFARGNTTAGGVADFGTGEFDATRFTTAGRATFEFGTAAFADEFGGGTEFFAGTTFTSGGSGRTFGDTQPFVEATRF